MHPKTELSLLFPLPVHQLAKRNELPDKPSLKLLVGQYVRLEPVVIARDAQPLFEVSNGSAIQMKGRSLEPYDADASIWRYMFEGPFKNLEDLAATLTTSLFLLILNFLRKLF